LGVFQKIRINLSIYTPLKLILKNRAKYPKATSSI
jgi:hypothetical protein